MDTEPWYTTYFGADYLKIDIQPNTAHEVAFIREALELRPGMSLLDTSCGYGRHLAPLVEGGVYGVGCDLSRFMLDRAAAHMKEQGLPSRLVCCDYRELPFDGEFDCAVNMFNSFGYFDREIDNYMALKSIAEALKPGGLFLLDLTNRDFAIRSMRRNDWFEHGDALILERKEFDAVRNRSEIDVIVVDKDGRRAYHHSIRLYSYTELTMLLEAAGFMVRTVFGGFGGETFDEHSSRMLGRGGDVGDGGGMKITFWGTRGSIPTPMTNAAFRVKVKRLLRGAVGA